jgi:hypothetical protein
MDTPASQAGRNGALLHMAVSYSPRKGVRLMWRKKLMQLLRILVIAAVAMVLLTTKAC